MNKTVSISILVIAFIGGFLIFYNPKPASSPTQDNSDVSNAPQKWGSKIDERANVIVTVTPSNLLFDSKEWTFDVVMDTHSVELNQDMTSVSVLIDDSGKEYKPLRWEGADAGGHHREGILVFGAINPMPSHLELKIKSVGGVERSFKWDIE